MSNLKQEMLLNQSLIQSVLKEVQEKNEKIMELELKLVKATILIEEGGLSREQGSSPTHGHPALVATVSTNRAQGPKEPNSTPLGTQGSACPHLGMGSQGEEVATPSSEREGATGNPGQAKHRLDQTHMCAELAEGNALGSDKCFENAFPNQTSREQTMVIQPTQTKHVAKQSGPKEVM